jgi:uncharacterized membrane protein
MESKVKIFGHPLHQMLVVFPLGLLAGSVVFDLIYLLGDRPWAAGVIAGLLAAPWGAIDWFAVPSGTRAKRIGAMHGLGNVVVLLLFALSWWWRRDQIEQPPTLAHVMSFAGAGLSLLTAWLGGELVDRLGVGVDTGAHLDSPSSLSGRPASEHARTRV